jgi:hypothetical protein
LKMAVLLEHLLWLLCYQCRRKPWHHARHSATLDR